MTPSGRRDPPRRTMEATILLRSQGSSPTGHNRWWWGSSRDMTMTTKDADGRRSFIPTSGRDPSVDTGSSSPTDCTDRSCCGSSRSIGGRRIDRAGCRTSGRPGLLRGCRRFVCQQLVDNYCPLNYRLIMIGLIRMFHRQDRLTRCRRVPPSRSSCWPPEHWPRT